MELKDFLLLACFGACVGSCESRHPESPATSAGLLETEIRTIAGRAADWQLAHLKHEPREWPPAVFYAGVMAMYEATGEPKYLEAMTEMGERNRWEPGPRYRHADDHAVAQTYLDLYRIERDPSRYEPFQASIDKMMNTPRQWPKAHQTIDYWWCDALFMSPPAIAKLASITGNVEYLDLLDRLWAESRALLYEEDEQLFHRDLRYRDRRAEAATLGRRADQAFWSRGNAWVLAGLALLLEELPADRASRSGYEDIFREMAFRIRNLQREDGLWSPNLLEASGPGESSGTALFCFAMAWAVNRGILDRVEFLPSVEKAWSAVYRNVDDRGRLRWVQRPGSAPDRVSSRNSEVYGNGALLLAASEMLALSGSVGTR